MCVPTHSNIVLGDGVREVRDGHGGHRRDALRAGEGRGRRWGMMLGTIAAQWRIHTGRRRAVVAHLHLWCVCVCVCVCVCACLTPQYIDTYMYIHRHT